jgi:hypothetical protein
MVYSNKGNATHTSKWVLIFMSGRIGLKAFPYRGGVRSDVPSGDLLEAIRSVCSVPLENGIYHSKRRRVEGRGQDGLVGYVTEIATSRPLLATKLLTALLVEQGREEFLSKGLPIPHEFRRR